MRVMQAREELEKAAERVVRDKPRAAMSHLVTVAIALREVRYHEGKKAQRMCRAFLNGDIDERTLGLYLENYGFGDLLNKGDDEWRSEE